MNDITGGWSDLFAGQERTELGVLKNIEIKDTRGDSQADDEV